MQLGTAKWVGAANEGLQLIAVGLGIFMCCCPRSCLPLLQTCLCFSSVRSDTCPCIAPTRGWADEVAVLRALSALSALRPLSALSSRSAVLALPRPCPPSRLLPGPRLLPLQLLCTGGLVVMSHNMVSRLNDVSQFHPLDLCPSLLKSACEAAGVVRCPALCSSLDPSLPVVRPGLCTGARSRKAAAVAKHRLPTARDACSSCFLMLHLSVAMCALRSASFLLLLLCVGVQQETVQMQNWALGPSVYAIVSARHEVWLGGAPQLTSHPAAVAHSRT